jgi:hypothetical protein
MAALVVLWAITSYPQARGILLGQMVILVFLAVVLALLALNRRHDFWAGAALATATIKPQVALLLVIWLLWWSAWNRRWQVWVGFWAILAVLVGASLILVPSWIPDFARHIFNYADVTISPYYSLTWMITQHFLGLGSTSEIIVTSLIGAYLLFEWWRCRHATGQTMLWVTGLTLNLTFFVAVQIATTAYIVLLIPLFQIFERLTKRGSRLTNTGVLAAAVVLLVGQWAIFLTTIDGNFETAPSYLLLPLGLLVTQVILRARLTEGHPRASVLRTVR